MLDHISLGVLNLARAQHFYDAAFAPLGYRRMTTTATTLGYGDSYAEFWLAVAERPVPADPLSGLHVCLAAPDRAAVEAFHRAALAAGGQDNGGPGLRPEYGEDYYAAFVIDPDGYRLEAYCGPGDPAR